MPSWSNPLAYTHNCHYDASKWRATVLQKEALLLLKLCKCFDMSLVLIEAQAGHEYTLRL